MKNLNELYGVDIFSDSSFTFGILAYQGIITP